MDGIPKLGVWICFCRKCLHPRVFMLDFMLGNLRASDIRTFLDSVYLAFL